MILYATEIVTLTKNLDISKCFIIKTFPYFPDHVIAPDVNGLIFISSLMYTFSAVCRSVITTQPVVCGGVPF